MSFLNFPYCTIHFIYIRDIHRHSFLPPSGTFILSFICLLVHVYYPLTFFITAHYDVPQNIHTPPRVFCFEPPPLWKFQFSLMLLLTSFWVLDIPLKISNDPPWRGNGYFLEPHITYYRVADLLTPWERTSGNVTSIYDTLTTRTFTSKGV